MNANSVPIPREVLEAPFPPEAIKSRPGAYGGSLSYLEGHTVVQRLNDAFDGNWSFEVVTHQVLDDEVLVLGKLRAETAGVVKMAFGSSRITKDDRTGKSIALGDDLKAAATDALKKSATLLGVGLTLYSNQPADSRRHEGDAPLAPARPSGHGNGRDHRHDGAGQRSAHNGGTGANGNGRITNRQLSAIFAIARERHMPNNEVRALAKEMFERSLDYLTKAEASSLIEHLLGR